MELTEPVTPAGWGGEHMSIDSHVISHVYVYCVLSQSVSMALVNLPGRGLVGN